MGALTDLHHEHIPPVPFEMRNRWEEPAWLYDWLVGVAANQVSSGEIGRTGKPCGDENRQVRRNGEKSGVEKSVKGCTQAHPVGWIRTVTIVVAPRYHMAGYQACLDRQTRYAAARLVVTEDGLPKKGLVQSFLCRVYSFGGTCWLGRGGDF